MPISTLTRSFVLGLTLALAGPVVGCAVPTSETSETSESRAQALEGASSDAPVVSWGFTAAGSEVCVTGDVAIGDRNASVPHARIANGDTLAISKEATLFTVINADFGGNGVSNFRLPDLGAAAPAGKAYFICTDGLYPSASIAEECAVGSVRWTAASRDRTGMEAADGRVVAIADYPALFSAIGSRYGGDGVTTFALPNAQSESPRGIKAFVCTGNVVDR